MVKVDVSQFASKLNSYSANPRVMKGVNSGKTGLVGLAGTYLLGDVFTNHKDSKTTLEEMKNNQVVTEKKSGFWRKFGSGIGNSIALTIPIYGTYRLGKIKNEREEMQKEIEALKNPNNEKTTKEPEKRTSNYLKGLVERLKFLLPVYNIVYSVKTVSTERQINKDVLELSKNNKPQTEVKVETAEKVSA